MRSLSLVMSQYSLSGRGQGHVSNFYIVDLEHFATASRRYTGDIHNSSDKVRGLCLVWSGRARVVEFSYQLTDDRRRSSSYRALSVDSFIELS